MSRKISRSLTAKTSHNTVGLEHYYFWWNTWMCNSR